MRRLVSLLLLLSPLLAGCERPAASDYQAASGAAGAGAAPVGGYERTMADGTRANLAGRASDALALFRQALKLQETQFGRGRPETALPLMSIALELSVAGQFPEADARFAEAERSLRAGPDNPARRAMAARLLHYRGEHRLNQKKPAEAETMLSAAQAAYTALVPEENLTRPPASQIPPNRFDTAAAGRLTRTQILTGDVNDPALHPVLLGLIEAIRYRAVALRELNRSAEADALIAYAARIAGANELGRPSVYARLYRTSGVTASGVTASGVTASGITAGGVTAGGVTGSNAAAGGGTAERALEDFGRSDTAFERALPETRPAAEAKLIRAGELMRAGRTGAALSLCRRAVRTLVAISSGTSPELMAPCLEAYAGGGGLFGGGGGQRAEMFLAAQVAQGTITSHQIAQASVALAENARDPAVGQALRTRDALQREVDRLYRALDSLGGVPPTGRGVEDTDRLQREATQRQAELARAEAHVRQVSPNYAQLVQDVVPARDVFAALRPNEAFVALFLSQRDGWTFALRNGEIAVARIDGGTDAIGPLVRRVRAGIEEASAVFDIDSTRRLYDLTLGRVASRFQGAEALVIAPTGPLLSVPFEVLLTGPADPAKLAAAPWLLRRATIAHVPAPTNFVSLRRVAAPVTDRAPRWFGFGDFRKVNAAQVRAAFPDSGCARDRAALAGLPPLPGATRELEGVRAILGASANDELTGDAFTAERVMARDLKSYQILHFAAHALLPTDLECQAEASIVTSPPSREQGAGGWLLTASRLLGLDLDATLVILSACNSGGADGKGGESLSGLARSFLFARARSLVVSHWPVNDKVGAALVQLMVKNLKDKPRAGTAGALRDAQLGLLDDAAAGKLPAAIGAPFYWAPFALIGEGGESAQRTVSSNP